jgi:hypothetical protein
MPQIAEPGDEHAETVDGIHDGGVQVAVEKEAEISEFLGRARDTAASGSVPGIATATPS